MLIHECPRRAEREAERKWPELGTLTIVVALVAAFAGVCLRGFPEQEREQQEVVAVEPAKSTERRPVVLDDPNWEPSTVIIFRARHEQMPVFITPEMKSKGATVYPARGFRVVRVLQGKLGVNWLRFSRPAEATLDNTYTFKWKPTQWAKEQLKSARKIGVNTISLWPWENVEVVEDGPKS